MFKNFPKIPLISLNQRLRVLCLCFMSWTFVQSQIPVTNEADLRAINNDLSGHYQLTQDIVLEQAWIPLATDEPFQGILDGNGHIIYNMRIDDSELMDVGFFSRIRNAQIYNIGFVNPVVNAGKIAEGINAGVFVGNVIASEIRNAFVEGGSVSSYGSAGSISGKITKGTAKSSIINVYSSADVIATKQHAGGIVAIADNAYIENTYFSGLAEAKLSCGGILGTVTGENTVLSSLATSTYVKGVKANRIIGEASGSLTLHNNYARTDMLVGSRNMDVVSLSESRLKGIQGESVPLQGADFASPYPDFTDADIEAATDAFNANYYSTAKRLYFESHLRTGKVSAIWTQANLYDLMVTQYQRTGDEKDYQLCLDILEGNRLQYANYNWDNGVVWFIYDDIMWWVISLAEAYSITKDEKYLNLSKSGFERVWSGSSVLKDNGSYDPVHGGMYWAWDQKNPEGTPLPTMGKMSCINYPTVIAAMTLFNATADSTYFYKGLEIYTWANNNLFDKELGRVPDSKHGNGPNANWKDHVYNQGTCIGAAMMLYNATNDRKYLDDAVLTANYTKNQMSTNGYMHFENGIEQGIYPAIFSKYIKRLIEDGKQYQYIPWLQYNINAGWANRIDRSKVTHKDFANPAPAISKIQSYDASALPALMQVTPTVDSNPIVINTQAKEFYEYNLNWDSDVWTMSEKDALPKLKGFNIKTGLNISQSKSSLELIYHNHQLKVNSLSLVNVEIIDWSGKIVQSVLLHDNYLQIPNGVWIVRAFTKDDVKVIKVIS
jgi:hypothetical protein